MKVFEWSITMLITIKLALSQFKYNNDTSANSLLYIDVSVETSRLKVVYQDASLKNLTNREKYCYNLPITTYRHSCNAVDSNCCQLRIRYKGDTLLSESCFPMGLEAQTIINFPKGNTVPSYTVVNTDVANNPTFFRVSGLGDFSITITCNAFKFYNSSDKSVMISSNTTTLAKNACGKISPALNIYKCRRMGSGCSLVVPQSNPSSKFCAPFDNYTIIAEVTPDDTPPKYTLVGNEVKGVYFTKRIKGDIWNIYTNPDVVLPARNNTNFNTYKLINSTKNTFDQEDLACFNQQSVTGVDKCKKANSKSNCCYYEYYDKGDTNMLVSGCMAFLDTTDKVNFTKTISTTKESVSIYCPKIIS